MPATETRVTHTPGPWERVLICADDDRTKEQLTSDGRAVMMLSHDGSDEGEANARLLAAAPDLLAALIALEKGHSMKDAEIARAAIAKAHGQ